MEFTCNGGMDQFAIAIASDGRESLGEWVTRVRQWSLVGDNC